MDRYNPFTEIFERLASIEQSIAGITSAPREDTAVSDRPLTVQEAAAFLNLTVPTIYSKVNRGELPYMKDSKRVYFLRSDLISYLKSKSHAVEA